MDDLTILLAVLVCSGVPIGIFVAGYLLGRSRGQAVAARDRERERIAWLLAEFHRAPLREAITPELVGGLEDYYRAQLGAPRFGTARSVSTWPVVPSPRPERSSAVGPVRPS